MTDIATARRPVAPASLQAFAERTSPGNSPCPRQSALDTLYREEHRALLAFLTRQIGKEHARDLAQEVFLRAAASSQLTELRNPGRFLRRIARNLLIDDARRKTCRIKTLPLVESRDASCCAEQEDRILADQAAVAFEKALADLPDGTARIFVMNRFEKKSYRQIHRELGIAPQTVDYHMMKALAHLRTRLGYSR